MNARALLISTRAIRPSTRCLVLGRPMQRRFASSEQKPSNISQFYKNFTRPVAKVVLLAFFTYQLAYWAWVKLETDEIIAEREAYISELEGEIELLTGSKGKAASQNNKPSNEEQIREYQMQLMLLEQKNKETLAAMERAKKEGGKGQETAPWWKVW